MTYCNLFTSMNFGFGFLAGNCLSNMLGRSFLGGYGYSAPVTMPMFMPMPMAMYSYYPPNFSMYSAPDSLSYSIAPPDYRNYAYEPPKFDSIFNNNYAYNNYSYPQVNFAPMNWNYAYNNVGNSNKNEEAQKAGRQEDKNADSKANQNPGSKGVQKSPNGVVIPYPKMKYTPTGKKHLYSTLSRGEALNRAKSDPNLENLTGGGNGWSLCSSTFKTDIPYARKGTKALLDRARRECGIDFMVTSALGTAGCNGKSSPHGYKDTGASYSHFNANNPKLDLQPVSDPCGKASNWRLAEALYKTGLFDIYVENNDGVWHLDVQLKESAYASL